MVNPFLRLIKSSAKSTAIQRGTKQQVDDLERLSELQQSGLGDEVRLQEQQQILGHGEYLLGWSYFLLSASKQHKDKQVLRDAESSFRSYLELAPYLNLTKFSADKFGKENRFQRSATVGLAVVMQAIGSAAQAEHCFKIAKVHAESASNPRREIENIARWQFIGLLNQGDFSSAKAMLTDQLRQPKLLNDSAILNAIVNRTGANDELTSLAMIELALSFQTDRLRKAIERSPVAFANLADLKPWIDGFLAWDDYQNEGDPQTLKLAIEMLQAAETKFSRTTRSSIRGHCLFLLASCNLEKHDYLSATNNFLSATKHLQKTDPDLAAEAAYGAFKAASLLPKDQRQTSEDIAVELINNFPRSRFAELARFELTLKRLNTKSDSEAIQRLARYRAAGTGVRPNIVVSAATVEMARRYESSAEKTLHRFREFVKTVNNDKRNSNRSKIETNYHYLSTLLAQTNSAELDGEIEGVLSKLQSLLDQSDSKKPKQTETARYIYYQLLVLRRLYPEDQSQAFANFQQLQSLNVDSPWTLAATTEAARFFEDVDDSRFAAEPILRQQMIAVYQDLQSILRSTESTNREAVNIKLSKLYLADGKIDAAIILAADAPENASWLPILAELKEVQGDLRQSEVLWQQLEQLLPALSDDWWEARLNRLRVMHKTEPEAAKETLERTISLYQNTSQSVSTRLQELARQWEAK